MLIHHSNRVKLRMHLPRSISLLNRHQKLPKMQLQLPRRQVQLPKMRPNQLNQLLNPYLDSYVPAECR